MKELINSFNNSFDQVYKKINIVDEKVDGLDKKMDKRFDELVKLIKEIKK